MLRTTTAEGEEIELYDLEKDPGENRNIATKHPDLLKEMKQILLDAYKSTPDYPQK